MNCFIGDLLNKVNVINVKEREDGQLEIENTIIDMVKELWNISGEMCIRDRIGCLKSFKVKNVISSNYVHTSKLYRSFVKAVKEDGLKMKHPPVGKSYRLGSASFQILAPETIEAKGSNNNSVAIKLTNKENSFIFTGDAEHESEKAMCNSGIAVSYTHLRKRTTT